jgi:Family of unknown function (DUF6262)
MRANNTAAIITAAQRRHALTRAKAIQALRKLDHAGTPITFETIARTAGGSRSWLDNQPDIRTEIQRLRDATRRAPAPPIPATQRATADSLRRRLEATNERLRQLTEDNQRLRRQIAQALGDRRATKAPGSTDQTGHSSITINPY